MSANYPCSICDFVFGNPRELGTHILTAHCNDTGGNGNVSGGNEEIDSKSNITLLTTSSGSASETTPTTTTIQNYTQGMRIVFVNVKRLDLVFMNIRALLTK